MANSPRKNQLDPFHDDDYGDYATEGDHDTGHEDDHDTGDDDQNDDASAIGGAPC